jgi:hypothetical protein
MEASGLHALFFGQRMLQAMQRVIKKQKEDHPIGFQTDRRRKF